MSALFGRPLSSGGYRWRRTAMDEDVGRRALAVAGLQAARGHRDHLEVAETLQRPRGDGSHGRAELDEFGSVRAGRHVARDEGHALHTRHTTRQTRAAEETPEEPTGRRSQVEVS